MRVKTISITYERKFNLGDFNSLAVGTTLWADLDEAEDSVEATRELFAQAKEMVKQQALPVLRPMQAQTKETFAGKEVG